MRKQEHEQMPQEQHEYGPVKGNGAPEPLLTLEKLGGQAGKSEARGPIPVNCRNQEHDNDDVGKHDKEEMI